MLSLGSVLRHLECVAWKPKELQETPWLRGHISEVLLTLPLQQGMRGRKRSATASKSVLQEHGFVIERLLRKNETVLTPNSCSPNENAQEIHRITKRKPCEKVCFAQTNRQESYPNWLFNWMFLLLPVSWKHLKF